MLSFDDDAAFIPLALAQARLFGGRVAAAGGKAAVSSIVVQARDKDRIDAAKREITALLRDRHRLPPEGGADDFTVDNQQSLIDTLTETSRTMTLYLASIAGDLADRRRHRHHEHHARLGPRTDPRDRPAEGHRRARPRHPDPVPDRGADPQPAGGLLGLAIGVGIAVVANASGQARAVVAPSRWCWLSASPWRSASSSASNRPAAPPNWTPSKPYATNNPIPEDRRMDETNNLLPATEPPQPRRTTSGNRTC